MKANHFLGTLTLGALVGIGVGYWIATDPVKRRKIGRFISNAEDKLEDIKDSIVEKYEDIKDMVKGEYETVEDLIEDGLGEVETIIITEIDEPEKPTAKKK